MVCAPSPTFTVLTIYQDRIDDLPADCHPRKRQIRIVFILCQEPAFIPSSADTTAKTVMIQLGNRLQTGKEIRPTLQALGTDVPSLAPDIPVLQIVSNPQSWTTHEDSVKDVKAEGILG